VIGLGRVQRYSSQTIDGTPIAHARPELHVVAVVPADIWSLDVFTEEGECSDNCSGRAREAHPESWFGRDYRELPVDASLIGDDPYFVRIVLGIPRRVSRLAVAITLPVKKRRDVIIPNAVFVHPILQTGSPDHGVSRNRGMQNGSHQPMPTVYAGAQA